jgi:hypothetical protein
LKGNISQPVWDFVFGLIVLALIQQVVFENCCNVRLFMITHTFVRNETGWVIQGKSKLDLIATGDAMMEVMANGTRKMTLCLSTRPFGKADMLVLKELCIAPKGGGYYIMQTYKGRKFEKQLWLCDLPLLVFGDLPEKLYVQRIDNQYS